MPEKVRGHIEIGVVVNLQISGRGCMEDSGRRKVSAGMGVGCGWKGDRSKRKVE